MADWSAIEKQAQITVFNDHIADSAALVQRLMPFDIVCIMRERTPLGREILAQLPNLRLIVSTGKRNASLDTEACKDLGVEVAMTEYLESGAPELTWSLLMALARNIPKEAQNLQAGGWLLWMFMAQNLPYEHPFRKLDSVLATPHIGHVTEET